MDTTELEALRYPIGRFHAPETITRTDRESALDAIGELPENLRHAIEGLSYEQLSTPYRPGGWTVRQVVHHLADSHMHAYLRMRFALTMDEPTIMPYDEAAWANLHDSKDAPADWSCEFLEALHGRWTMMMKGMSEPQWQRAFIHPEGHRRITLEISALMYGWHSQHHLAHIYGLRHRMKW